MKTRYFDSAAEGRVHLPPYTGLHGALSAIGNGELMLYGRGPEWTQVIGVPYSCPTVFSLTAADDDPAKCATKRRDGVNSWMHEMESGVMTDCASREYGCLARHWKMTGEAGFLLQSHGFEITDQTDVLPGANAAWLINIPGDAHVYNDYPLMTHSYMLVALRGDCSCADTADGIGIVFRGEGDLIVTGAKSWKQAVADMRRALETDFDDILESADSDDRRYLDICASNRRALKQHPLTEETLRAVEDTALQIRAQQHTDGGVQAGHNYHLAYVRDQYGVARGLIAMGAWTEARRILEFYRTVFSRWGYIANAQAMGVDGIFHVHENDEVEITGYLLLQACDLYEADGDEEFFISLKPMLDWALKAQLKWLHNDMLPFNGDETYVAGGLIPRTALNHGSFEATMLLVAGGRRYIGYCGKFGIYESWMEDAAKKIEAAHERFEENFRRGDIYVTNSLKYLDGYTEPEFRHGVCLGGDAFEWLRRVDEGVYMCPRCAGKKTAQPYRREDSLKSTLLMEAFVRAGQIDSDYLAAQTAEFLNEYRTKGSLPSRPDGNVCLGYDFGLMLFAAKQAGINADDLLAHMLGLRDECGAWSEYYEDNAHKGTRCRPWESAINIAGALKYLEEGI